MARRKAKQDEPLETQLWKTANKLRKNINAAEYKHAVLSLIFLKYISDAFEHPSLHGMLPKVHARGNLDPTNLGGSST